MSKLTPFGAALRKLRIDHEMRLFDLAQLMKRSTAMLSAIETGRKQIPDGFVAEIVRAMVLSSSEHKQLRAAKDKTLKEVRVDHLPPSGRELVAAFARNNNEIPDDLLAQIRKVVMKSCDNEIPFKRMKRGFRVAPMSKEKIEALAQNVRNAFGYSERHRFPIIEVIEMGLPKISDSFVFEVLGRDEMGNDEGRVIAGKNSIILRVDVYDAACQGDGRGRFTAAHELGHYLMHQEISFARAREENEPIYSDAEWQADAFAGNLMIPRNLSFGYTCPTITSHAFGTSEHAAKVMLSKYSQ